MVTSPKLKAPPMVAECRRLRVDDDGPAPAKTSTRVPIRFGDERAR